MKTNIKHVPSVILAGGQGHRMGGVDKCLLSLGQTNILSILIEKLRDQSERILLNANGDPKRFNGFDVPVISDPLESAIGPLGGVLAAMEYLANSDAEWVMTVSGDSPFLPDKLQHRLLMAAQRSNSKIVYCKSAGRDHFVIALWSLEIIRDLKQFIQGGGRSVGRFIQTQQYEAVEFDSSDQDPFFNINTPEQWQEAKKMVHD